MSLILTQSTPTNGNANSYITRFKNTFELPPNAEIAVQEVVLNRDNTFFVGPNARFYIRHGATEYDRPIIVTLTEGSYRYQQMANHIQERLRACDTHPQWQQNWLVKGVLKGDVFHQFQIKASQSSAIASPGKPVLDDVIADEDITYSATTGLVTNSGTRSETLVLTNPLSSNDGVFQVELDEDNNSRNLTIYLTSTSVINQGIRGKLNEEAVYKMVVRYNGEAFDFQLAQTTRVGDKQGLKKVAEGKFEVANTYLTFLLEVDKLSVIASPGANHTQHAETLFDEFNPVCSAFYALFPVLQLSRTVETTINKYSGVSNYDLTARALDFAENRDQQRLAMIRATEHGSAGYGSISKGYLEKRTSLIMQPNPVLGVEDASLGDEIGFYDSEKLAHKSSPGNDEFLSTPLEGEVAADEAMYVRLTGLTFESQNGTVGGPSRIIQPLTRFTDNKTYGHMHFVPPQRTYLKLHNPNKLTVQEIQVDIVNAHETLVQDLLPTTCVTLHVK